MALSHDKMKEQMKSLIDKLDYDKLEKHYRQMLIDSIPEEEPTEEEKKAIEQALEEVRRGETVTYTIDELRKEFLEDE